MSPEINKRLSRKQASVMKTDPRSAHADADVMAAVAAMVELGARPATIVELTGMSSAVVGRICRRARGTGPTLGRVPTSVVRLFANRELHLEASLFLRFFVGLHIYTETLDARILIEALHLSRMAMDTDAYALSFEAALLVAERYLMRDVALRSCRKCDTRYLRNSVALKMIDRLDFAQCPTCRRHTAEKNLLAEHDAREAD